MPFIVRSATPSHGRDRYTDIHRYFCRNRPPPCLIFLLAPACPPATDSSLIPSHRNLSARPPRMYPHPVSAAPRAARPSSGQVCASTRLHCRHPSLTSAADSPEHRHSGTYGDCYRSPFSHPFVFPVRKTAGSPARRSVPFNFFTASRLSSFIHPYFLHRASSPCARRPKSSKSWSFSCFSSRQWRGHSISSFVAKIILSFHFSRQRT